MLRRFRDTPLPAARVRRLGALLLLLGVAACGGPKVDALGPGSRVLALGDSLTYGTGATPETSYPAALAALTKWTVVNAGVPGEVAQQGCARLAPLVAEHRPELILVFLGGNDILRRGSIQALNEGLAHCAEVAHRAKVPMVLFAVPRFEMTGFSDVPLFANVAKSMKVDFLSPQLGKLLSDEKLRSDQVHLNADGYRAMAGNVAQELRRLGYLRH